MHYLICMPLYYRCFCVRLLLLRHFCKNTIQHLCWCGIHSGIQCRVAFYCRRMILRRILKKRWWQQQHFASFQTDATFDNVESLALAAEEMVVCHFKQMNILTAIITLIASYYVLNADYPKGLGSQ